MEQKNEVYDQFPTQDFYIACVLKSFNIPLLEILRNQTGRATFVFANQKNVIEKVIQKHLNKELKVTSLDLVEAINQLKTRLYSGV